MAGSCFVEGNELANDVQPPQSLLAEPDVRQLAQGATPQPPMYGSRPAVQLTHEPREVDQVEAWRSRRVRKICR
jgi:hypothetical protein